MGQVEFVHSVDRKYLREST